MPFASMVFNGSDEYITRTNATSSPGTTLATVSWWHKIDVIEALDPIWQSINAAFDRYSSAAMVTAAGDFGHALNSAGTDREEATATGQITAGNWEHWVVRFDTTQGTADNRRRFYKNGSLVTDSGTSPNSNENHTLFTNGYFFDFGVFRDTSAFFDGRMAFIDVVDGLSLDGSSFAFDNGGTWTRKKYTGSYGTYGFSLDGSEFGVDVSGNGLHFSGVNMDASNLDLTDLPPYRSVSLPPFNPYQQLYQPLLVR